MRPDVQAATDRAIAARAQLAALAPHSVPPPEIEGELCSGYMHALDGDAWLAQVEDRLTVAVAADRSSPINCREPFALAAEHNEFRLGLIALRRELAALRDEHDRLRLTAHAA